MKVLIINSNKSTGSTGKLCTQLINNLKRHHDIEVFYAFADEKIESKNEYKINTRIDQMMHKILSRVFGLQGYFSSISTKKLINYIKINNIDIVHLNNSHANYLNLIKLFNYLNDENKGIVLTLHDCWYFTGHCCHYTIEKCNKWKEECKCCPQIKKWNKSWLFDTSNKMFNDKKNIFTKSKSIGIVGVSKWITEQANQSILGQSNFIIPIYNWVDFDTFRPKNVDKLKEKLKLKDKFVVISVASIWNSSKNLEKIIEVSENAPTNYVFIVIGKVKNKEILKKDNIIYIEKTKNQQLLAEYYSLADVLLNVSLEETFGMTVAEAMSCGTPVVSVNSTANPELINKDTGLIVENNAQAIIEALKKIEFNQKRTYSDKCIVYAHDIFSIDKNCEKYYELYNNINNLIKEKNK